MPKQIQTHSFGTALVNKFGLKGRFQPVLDETIVPVVLVDDFTEIRTAMGTSNGTVAAVVGENGLINLSNASTSPVDLVVVGLAIHPGTANNFRCTLLPWSKVGMTIVTSRKSWRNSERAGEPAGTVITGSQATATLPDWFYEVPMSNAGRLIPAAEFTCVITPGDQFTAFARTANASISSIGILWEEVVRNVTVA